MAKSIIQRIIFSILEDEAPETPESDDFEVRDLWADTSDLEPPESGVLVTIDKPGSPIDGLNARVCHTNGDKVWLRLEVKDKPQLNQIVLCLNKTQLTPIARVPRQDENLEDDYFGDTDWKGLTNFGDFTPKPKDMTWEESCP